MRRITYCLLAIIATTCNVSYCFSQNQARPTASNNIPEAYTHSVDSLSWYIDAHFDTDRQKAETIYAWITNNLTYNVYTTFTSRNEVYSEERDLQRTLQSRKGICKQFALLFRTLAENVGIPAFVVSGYNKSNGTLLPTPHEWCAAKVDGQWYFYDPTFGMGYVTNSYQFIHRPTMKYCQVSPEKMIRTHMPYDPIWQLLPSPCTYDEFDKNTYNPPHAAKNKYDFNDSILVYVQQPRIEQLTSSYLRARHNGTANPLVDYYLQLTQSNINVYKQKQVYEIYLKAMKLYNQSTDLHNEFIRLKRQKFRTEKNEETVKGWLHDALLLANRADSLLSNVQEAPPQYESAVRNLQASTQTLAEKLGKMQEFAELYYASSSKDRKKLLEELK